MLNLAYADFLALDASCRFSCAQHWLHDLLRLATAYFSRARQLFYVFQRLATVARFPALSPN